MAPWQEQVKVALEAREKSTPKQWLLPEDKLPPKTQQNVVDVPRTSGILTEEEVEITEQDVPQLLEAYRTKKWTVRQVVTAFLKKSVIIHQLTNFVTEFLADEALQRADDLDTHLATQGSLSGPLHGIPVSVKEQLSLANHINHGGFVALIANPAPAQDAHLARLFRQAGAVLITRTNIPQSLMHLDCENNILGRTLNPRHLLLSPGGSSGGEGVSIGARCAALGIGTDIGGSVRIPAAFNACYGLRPTALRVPVLGQTGVSLGQESIRGVAGPLAHSVEGLEIWMRSVLEQEPWEYETSLMPVPWRKDVKLGKGEFVVGVLWDDGIVKPHPPILRALKHAVSRLKEAGVKVVDWEPYDHQRGWDVLAPLYFPDGGQRWLTAMSNTGEPILPLTQHALDFSISTGKTPLTIPDNWDLNVARETYRREHHLLMKTRGVDFILCPVYPGAGVLQGQPRYWGYTSIWNILDLPAAVLPSGLACDKVVDGKDEGFKAMNEKDEEEQKAYDPELFHGFPIALQLVGKRFRDEDVLAAAKVLDDALKSKK
ncbi:hypothetical protein M406DRAFT_94271 [Cryphonectria parasitica EP155]|uniref:amidase n=1 Tax=Cryphonectria parasitica (strain ATCC 38755 / EP155) TaxID=660469 RepID=A0A9P4XYC6_CRYP1|nr:uncharacterized protein M406DRAFT_94271 [Cryphonectria parasitica EP155]KAF3763258.1 hypothetical protein M406DRAFT_94271 [Cryphonectria parasitica EP155]